MECEGERFAAPLNVSSCPGNQVPWSNLVPRVERDHRSQYVSEVKTNVKLSEPEQSFNIHLPFSRQVMELI